MYAARCLGPISTSRWRSVGRSAPLRLSGFAPLPSSPHHWAAGRAKAIPNQFSWHQPICLCSTLLVENGKCGAGRGRLAGAVGLWAELRRGLCGGSGRLDRRGALAGAGIGGCGADVRKETERARRETAHAGCAAPAGALSSLRGRQVANLIPPMRARPAPAMACNPGASVARAPKRDSQGPTPSGPIVAHPARGGWGTGGPAAIAL